MGYGDRDRTRRLAGNPSTANVSDADIDQALVDADVRVNLLTGRSWQTTDAEYKTVQQAAEYFAASVIRSRFNDEVQQEAAKIAKSTAQQLCEMITRQSSLGIHVKSSKYRTFPLNKDAKVYRSIPGDDET